MKSGLLRVLPLALILFAGPGIGAVSPVDEAAQSLAARAKPVTWIEGHRTGSAWKSVIQAPHYQTDRDIGAAGVGMAFLAAYDTTGNAAWLKSASAAGDFLLAAQTPGQSGRWPAYYDPAGPASYGFTSVDEGAAGIADFLWRLYERTGNARDQTTALAAMDWLISKAEAPKGGTCPGACLWDWQDPAFGKVYTGMGEGVAGIAGTLDAFAQRRAQIDPIGAARYELYAQSAAVWLESQMVRVKLPNGKMAAKMPQEPGSKNFDTGFASGSAGDAFLFYQLFASTGRREFRRDADLLLNWVRAQGVADATCGGLKWPVQAKGLGRKLFATGFEDGAAGIGWVAIQGYKTLRDRQPELAIKDLQLARAAGDWLLSSCAGRPKSDKAYWPETQDRRLAHTSLDAGAPGIGIFLYDLYGITGAPAYRDGAIEAQKWIESVALHDRKGVYWCDSIRDDGWHLCGEPSWRWGQAGVIDFAARLQGWPLDIPGEQPGFAFGQ